jgi:hypothetical protein
VEIANSLGVKPATIKSYLTGSGASILRSYCLNAQVAEALGITEAPTCRTATAIRSPLCSAAVGH